VSYLLFTILLIFESGAIESIDRINPTEEDQHDIDRPRDEDTDDSEMSVGSPDIPETQRSSPTLTDPLSYIDDDESDDENPLIRDFALPDDNFRSIQELHDNLVEYMSSECAQEDWILRECGLLCRFLR
jgi:hypothetical protein